MIRNLLTTLRKFKLASTLNIVGLAIAFAAFLIMMIYVKYEYSFDSQHKKADRIYYGIITTANGAMKAVPRPFINALGSCSAAVESYTLVSHATLTVTVEITNGDQSTVFYDQLKKVDSTFADIFDLNMICGERAALGEPNKILLPRSIAEKFFGTAYCVGQTVHLKEASQEMVVGGVFEDFEPNSQLENVIYYKMDDRDLSEWKRVIYMGYFVLAKGADPRAVEADFARNFDLRTQLEEPSARAELVPLKELYFDSRELAPKHGNRTTINILLAIAILVIAVAAINFVNFSTSLTPLRIKGFNIRKIVGSQDLTLRATLIFEAAGIALIAYLLSLVVVSIAADTPLQQYLTPRIDLASNLALVIYVGLIAVAVGILAGIYPAFYSTRFAPVMVLKGSFAMSPQGRALRTTLIGFQFTISTGLIIGAILLQLQNSYMRYLDTGMDKENVAMFEVGGDLMSSKKEIFNSLLRANSQVMDVAYCQSDIGASNNAQNWGMEFKDGQINFDCYPCSWNFPSMMGIELVQGSHYKQGYGQRIINSYIFNETAAKRYNITLTDGLHDFSDSVASEIRAIAKDFNYASLHKQINPMAFVVLGTDLTGMGRDLPQVYVKFRGDPSTVIDHIKRSAASLAPNYTLSVKLYDKVFEQLYNKELKTTALITLCSLLAVIIALVGVFGLVVFETQYRRREIGLRKVYGSTVIEILVMFNRKFVWIVLICFLVACPIAYFGVAQWLESFAYRTPIYWWVFVLALIIVMLITLLTVTVQSYRAATENPIKSITN